VLYSSSSGIHATVLSSSLEVLRQHRQISAGSDSTRNPSAVFSNDLLTVAWEDYRSGVADIYGKKLAPGAILSTEAVAGVDENEEMKVSPNPVQEELRIELPTNRGVVLLELYDQMGRRVITKAAENAAATYAMDVSAIPGGVYMLVARAGEKVRHQQIVVLH
jgi:hypothetical protein